MAAGRECCEAQPQQVDSLTTLELFLLLFLPAVLHADDAFNIYRTSSQTTRAAGGLAAAAVAAAPAAVVGMGWLAGQQQAQHPGLAQHDDLSSLLEALAAVYRVRPGLWHNKEAPAAFPYITTFMSHVSHMGWCLVCCLAMCCLVCVSAFHVCA